jgi:hypothetical protein
VLSAQHRRQDRHDERVDVEQGQSREKHRIVGHGVVERHHPRISDFVGMQVRSQFRHTGRASGMKERREVVGEWRVGE